MNYRCILASNSPRRKELLKREGVEFEVIGSKNEEITSKILPNEVVVDLATSKASDVALMMINGQTSLNVEKEGTYLIIGADTIVAVDDQILGKPKSKEDACNMLKSLSNRTHSVFTGVCLIVLSGLEIIKTSAFVDETRVNMRKITDDEIISYVETGEPMDKAGAYAIQGGASTFVTSIDGDYDNVVGLPVKRVLKEMNNLMMDEP